MQKSSNYVSIRRLVITGMLAAVIVVMMLTGVGLMRIGPVVAFTFLCLPVIIGVMSEGLAVGLVLGFAFGLISFIQAFSAPSLLSPYLMNPLVSVVPRLLIPVVTWLVLRALHPLVNAGGAKRVFARGAAALAGSLTNTVLVLGSIFIISKLGFVAEGLSTDTIGPMLLGVVLSNGLPEAACMTIVAPPVMAALDRSIYRTKGV